MKAAPLKILVTGGKGFIGSAVVRHLINETDHEVVNVDKMTYAATEGSTQMVADSRRPCRLTWYSEASVAGTIQIFTQICTANSGRTGNQSFTQTTASGWRSRFS